jgi:hypothetical protein
MNNRKANQMLKVRLFSLAAVSFAFAGMFAMAPSATAAPRQGGTPFCISGGLLCAYATPQQYNRCYSLALSRGWSSRRFDDYGRNTFMYGCLIGKIR